ncbi:MAG: hypothetical protein NTU53_01330 [Planctomycetota bacterium]|nr:hypothetical protein [Planctomycetota bacterium]
MWSADAGGNNREIFLYDLNTNNTKQLTINGIDDRDPRISGQNLVWWQGDGGPEDQVMLYDGATTRQITPVGSTFHNGGGRSPDVSGDKLVYVGNDGGNADHLILYDIATGTTSTKRFFPSES